MQEFFPQSRSSQTDESEEQSELSIQQPASWSNTSRTGDVTKNEHPSAFEEEAVPLYSYPAQDRRRPGGEQAKSRPQPESARTQQGFSPDGDALEHGYHPYQAPWARTRRQRQRPLIPWLLLIFLVILVIKLIPILAALVITLLGIGLFLILLPALIVLGFVLVFGGLVLFVLSKMGFPVWRNLFRPRHWSKSWRGR